MKYPLLWNYLHLFTTQKTQLMRFFLFSLMLFLSCHTGAWAQRSPLPAQTYRQLHGNSVKALFNPGSLFWDGQSMGQFQVPYQSGTNTPNTLFAGGLWLGAYDPGGNLRLAAQTYRSQGNDYWAGPMDSSTLQVLPNGDQDFDHIWSVKRWETEAHQQDFNADGVINGPVPPAILAWPGKGNPQFATTMGFALPNQSLAPFFDRNGNGLYEPMLGDYPVYDHGNATAVAEDMLWYVFNDAAGVHTQSRGYPMNAEIQVTAWSFQCQGNDLLNQTIFVRHKVINRGMDWYDFKIGLWHDPDLGCYNDDFMGVDTALHTVYWYNRDNDDDNPCGSGGIPGYGLNPPAQTMTFLNQPLSSCVSHVNLNQSPLGTPIHPFNYYHVLSGLWQDGTPMIPVGTGYNPNSTLPATLHAFHGSLLDTSSWTMFSPNYSTIDSRDLSASHKALVRSGESFTLDVAYAYHRDPNNDHLQNALLALQQVPQVQQWYDNGIPNCIQRSICSNNCVYPGDMNNNGIASDYDLLDWAVAVGQNATAAPRTSIQDDWFPYNLPAPATNGYADANGDGTIDQADWNTNTDNLGLTHPLYTGANEGSNLVGSELALERFQLPFLPPPPLLRPGRGAAFTVALVDSTTTLPVEQLYGLVFRVEFDENVFDRANWHSTGTAFQQHRYSSGIGHLGYVGVKTDGNSIGPANNMLGRFSLWVRSDVFLPYSLMQTDICIRDIKAIDSTGQVIPLGTQCFTVEYATNSYQISVPTVEALGYQATLYPNPTKDQTTLALTLEQPQDFRIQLLDVTGRVVYQETIEALGAGHHTFVLPTEALPVGVYHCQILTKKTQQVLSLVKGR